LFDPHASTQSLLVTRVSDGYTVPKSVTFAVPVAQPVASRLVADTTVAATVVFAVEDDPSAVPITANDKINTPIPIRRAVRTPVAERGHT